ncbi:MAG: flavodoxin [Chloroflexota bacterium]
MTKIGIFYGSNTGNTEESAEAMEKALANVPGATVEVLEISGTTVGKIPDYDKLIFGIPTWYVGEIQEDWDAVLPELKEMDLTGKQVAIFGHGDMYGYPDTYQDAIGIVGEICLEIGTDLVGWWSTDGYEYDESIAEVDGMFMGLSLDDHQTELHDERIEQWIQQLIVEFALQPEVVAGS